MQFLLLVVAACSVHLSVAIPVQSNQVTYAQMILSGINQFSTDFYQRVIENEKGNVVTSPMSAHMALGMTSFGAEGETLRSLREGLHMGLDHNIASEGYSTLMRILTAEQNLGVTLKVASKIFTAAYFTPKEKFQNLLKSTFNSECQAVDFDNVEKTTQIINNWVAQETNHKIEKAFDSDSILPSSLLLLLNTIYFNGKWTYPFNEIDTNEAPFFVDGTTIERVNMMFNTLTVLNGKVEGLPANFAILPYGNGLVTMTIVVPEGVTGLSLIEKNMHLLKHENLQRTATNNSINVNLPRFKIESSLDLETPLQKMGMGEIFTNAANFDGIADLPMKVSKVLQKVFIEVNESGTEAAAESSALTSSRSSQNEISVNRPSLIIIRIGNVDLFVARLVNPNK